MAFLRALTWLLWAGVAAAGVVLVVALHPGTSGLEPGRLDLSRPIGRATPPRLAALADDAPRCRALLDHAGIAFRPLAAIREGASCGFDDGVAWQAKGAREASYAPTAPALACPLAAGLALWEWDVVQPAAARLLDTTVVGIDHFGTYACRRIHGRRQGIWSEHARADAIDIAGFRLANGRRITVTRDWAGDDAAARFLHAVRDGACRLFGTTLSPDYNAAHHDHLHLDQARRGGSRACR